MATNHALTATVTASELSGSLPKSNINDGVKASSGGDIQDWIGANSSPSVGSPQEILFEWLSNVDLSGAVFFHWSRAGVEHAETDNRSANGVGGLYCFEDFLAKYWDGAAYQPWFSVTGNVVLKTVHPASSINTSKLLIQVTKASPGGGYCGCNEIELWDTLPDLISPTVSITVPSGTTNISGNSVNLQGTCADNIEVVGIQLKLNGVNWGAEITGSGLTSFNVTRNSFDFPNGTYTLTAVVRDPAGNTTASAGKTVNIQNAPTAGFSIPSTGVVDVPVTITDESANAASYAYDKENDGITDSTDDEPSFTYSTPGTYTIKQIVTNSYGSNNVTHSIVISDALPLNYGFDAKQVELFCEADYLALSDGNNVTSFTDQSIHSRHLTAPGAYPTFQTNEINSKPVVRFSSSNPLKNTAEFTVKCGWIIAKYNGAQFPPDPNGYMGLLTGISQTIILVGQASSIYFYDTNHENFEFRSNDRIYSRNDDGDLAAPAPMNAFKLIFFRFWTPIEIDGIQLGQERGATAEKWSGDVALLILTSRDFCEREIRARSEAIASAYNLTLADVIPFQGSKSDETTYERPVNIYDPPEGERIAEVLDEVKQSFDLNFSLRRNDEFKKFRAYYKNHYPEVPCIYRDYNILPPEDVEGYFDSALRKSGFLSNNYSVRFKEK